MAGGRLSEEEALSEPAAAELSRVRESDLPDGRERNRGAPESRRWLCRGLRAPRWLTSRPLIPRLVPPPPRRASVRLVALIPVPLLRR